MKKLTDKERLDWLDKWQGKLEASWQTSGDIYIFGDMAELLGEHPNRGVCFKSYRAAIAAAMRAEKAAKTRKPQDPKGGKP